MSDAIKDLIRRKAEAAGIDPMHALTMASIETGGTFNPGLTSPTGSGKTEMAKALLARARSPLALCHTRVLLQQTVRRVPRARVMTIQSLLAAGAGGDKRRASLSRFDMCFIDEF